MTADRTSMANAVALQGECNDRPVITRMDPAISAALAKRLTLGCSQQQSVRRLLHLGYARQEPSCNRQEGRTAAARAKHSACGSNATVGGWVQRQLYHRASCARSRPPLGSVNWLWEMSGSESTKDQLVRIIESEMFDLIVRLQVPAALIHAPLLFCARTLG